MALFFKPTISFPLNISLDPPKLNPRSFITMNDTNNFTTPVDSSMTIDVPMEKRKLPILLFDVMDTIVRDPFYHDIPAFFG